MDSNRRRFIKLIGATGVVGLAGCTGGPDEPTDTEEPADGGDGNGDGAGGDGDDGGSDGGDGGDGEDGGTETTEPDGTEAAEQTHVGMVYATGGLGDGSFNDQAQQGLYEAEEDMNVAYQEAQPEDESEFGTFQQQFADSTDPDYDLVCCIGFLQTDALSSTAENYPDQNFTLVDSVVEAPNVANYGFKEHEGSYLVGQLAALLTTREFSAGAGETNADAATVGYVGGIESDLIRKFEAGFTAGVADTDDSVEVLTNYVGDFNDPSGGREAALAMYNNGADVVYHAAGNTGTGVFQAAQDQGRYAIGVDRDQSVTKDSFSDVILASMVKRVDTSIYDAIESVVEDDFPGGSTVSLGLEQDGVDLVYGQELGDSIPDDVTEPVADSRQGIIDGDISVPESPDDV